MKKFIKRIVRFVGKVFAYLPVLWRDEDYDYAHILSLLQYKLKRTRLHILKHDIILDAQEVADQITHAETLIQRLQDDDYLPELEKAHTEKYGEQINTSRQSANNPDCDIWTYHRAKATTPELHEQERKEQQEIWRLVEEAREKDWNELFLFLRDNVRNWWD